MAKYTILEEAGHLYCVVVKEDGSSFGQITGETTREAIEAVINAALARNGRKERTPEVVEAIQTRAEISIRKS